MANIIITTHWSDGDVIPFISIGKYLKKIGHDVTIFTHCCYAERIKKENMNFVSWDTLEEYTEFFGALVKFSNTVAGIDEIESFRAKYESVSVRLKEYELLKPYCERQDTVLVAKNRSSIASLLISEKLKCPLVWVYMNPYEYESIENFNSINGENLCKESNDLRERIGLKPIDSWLAWLSSPKGKIGLWPSWYKSSMINELNDIDLIGFPLEPLDKSKIIIPEKLKDLLLEDTSPIIISGGSSNKIKKEFYEIAINSSIHLGRKVIVACKYKELLPEEIPKNVYVFHYIPLYESLAYASLIIHHGGIGTVSNAIKAGIPQLILADCSDTPLNGAIVKKLGLGDYLPPLKWTEDNVKNSIKSILDEEHKRKCIDFAKNHERESAFESIKKVVENAMKDDEYIINYHNIKSNFTINDNLIKKNISKSKGLSKDMRKYLLEKSKKGKDLS